MRAESESGPEALVEKLRHVSKTLSEIEDWLDRRDEDRVRSAHTIPSLLSTVLARKSLTAADLDGYLRDPR
ncbi:MAG: hypothetical protein ACUVYA_08955 [Planctomycetota bacterium]